MNYTKRSEVLIRWWFEFYKLALATASNPEKLEELLKTYSEWGDVRNLSFDAWWKGHRQVFFGKEVHVMNSLPNAMDAEMIYIAIPTGRPAKETLRNLRGKIVEALRTRTPKVGKPVAGRFKYVLRQQTRIQPSKLQTLYDLYKLIHKWRLEHGGSDPTAAERLEAVREYYRRNPGNRKPSGVTLSNVKSKNVESQLRSLRREVEQSNNIVANLWRLHFPDTGANY